MPRVPVVFACLATLSCLPLSAQFVQYVEPGSLGERTEDAAETAKQSAETARWNLGKIALDPRFSVRELGYYENVFASGEESSEVDDVRATVGAGLAAYLHAGSKSLFSVYLTPEYTYWQDQDDLSGLSTSWGAGWFGLFNNLLSSCLPFNGRYFSDWDRSHIWVGLEWNGFTQNGSCLRETQLTVTL